MKLTVFNGSPRGVKSNTRLLLEYFLKGFEETPGNTCELFYLNHLQEGETFVQAFNDAETVMLAFPLYTDSMPGLVKAFIDSLEPCLQKPANPPLLFLVQSGFPEAHHSRYVEKYLARLAGRLNSPYLGTIVRGGIEGIQMQPEKWTRQLTELFQVPGQTFGREGRLDEEQLRKTAQPEKLPGFFRFLFPIFNALGLGNSGWDTMLKQNNAFEKRFDRPYE